VNDFLQPTLDFHLLQLLELELESLRPLSLQQWLLQLLLELEAKKGTTTTAPEDVSQTELRYDSR
jgi:hypothetical protein